jgi:ribosomal protein S1
MQNPQELVGKEIKVSVIELNRPLRKVIFSQKATVAAEDFEKATKSLKSGQEARSDNLKRCAIWNFLND